MKFNIAAICDKGCVRNNNEDKILIPGFLFTDFSHSFDYETECLAVYAVADGMGGHNAGEVASEMVLESLEEFVSKLPPALSFENLKYGFNKWAADIHSTLLRIGRENPENKGMGTTLTGLLFYHGNLFCFNAGDSRTYRFRNGVLRQLTIDHTLAEATQNPNVPRNYILNSIGGGEKTFIDLIDLSGRVLGNDLFLMCSDGLTDMLSDEKIEKYLLPLNLPALVDYAKNRGGKDNISVLTVKIME